MYSNTRLTIYQALLGKVKRETAKATLFELVHPVTFKPVGELIWFPISQCAELRKEHSELDGTFDILVPSEWILKEKKVLGISVSPMKAIEINASRKTLALKGVVPEPVIDDATLHYLDSIGTEVDTLPDSFKNIQESDIDSQDIPF